ncbi:MAG TPA: alpha/beta hydrolase [Roseiflexaceae bacterium]|nr:alpha/beta hydrolase [Roseiflexaceae bacterium]
MNDREALHMPLDVERREWEAAAAQATLPPNIAIAPVVAAGMPAEWVSSPSVVSQAVLYYLHGGGFTAGSCVTHRELAARLCLASGVRALLIDYRLAPEHPFPAALEDAAAGYQWLLAQGIASEQIVIGGDSAGGGLALATMVWLREHAVALPAAGVLLSPWTDLALSGPSMRTRAELDPLCSEASLRRAARWYLAGADSTEPFASPVYAELYGLPPLLIQVGDHEILLSDSSRVAEQARSQGIEVTLEVYDELWHVFHGWAGALPEGQQAIERIGAFVHRKLAL